MRRIIQRIFSIVSILCGFGCVEIASVKAEPPSYQTRTEIDFDKMDVSGSLTDPIPRVYDGIPRYYDTADCIVDYNDSRRRVSEVFTQDRVD